MIADVIEAMRLGRLATDYEGLVAVKAGPSGLGILNYTDLCQRVGAHNPAVWDEVTRFCRGLILDTRTWTVAAWPFSKFFNVGETAETQPEALPKESFTVFEKVDGSLGVLYRGEDGQLAVASRGSFTSDQAIRGTAMLRQLANLDEIPDNLTMVFEIVFTENNSTVKYDFDGLVLLAIFNRETGEELAWSEVESWAGRLGCRLPKVYQFGSLAELLRGRDDLGSNVEGFVVLFASGLRAKLKGEWYLDHHRQAWGLSEKTVLEALATGRSRNCWQKFPMISKLKPTGWSRSFRAERPPWKPRLKDILPPPRKVTTARSLPNGSEICKMSQPLSGQFSSSYGMGERLTGTKCSRRIPRTGAKTPA